MLPPGVRQRSQPRDLFDQLQKKRGHCPLKKRRRKSKIRTPLPLAARFVKGSVATARSRGGVPPRCPPSRAQQTPRGLRAPRSPPPTPHPGDGIQHGVAGHQPGQRLPPSFSLLAIVGPLALTPGRAATPAKHQGCDHDHQTKAVTAATQARATKARA